MNKITKPSEAIRFAITSGMYVGNEVYHKPTAYGQPAKFMCHSITRMAGTTDSDGVLTHKCMSETLNLIEMALGDVYALSTHLSRLDDEYRQLVTIYSDEHPACFELRLEWWDKFIENLEKEGK